jgi:hypothetical protein
MLNPNKQGGWDDAEAARKVAEKTLAEAGVDVKNLRNASWKSISPSNRGSVITVRNILGDRSRKFWKQLELYRRFSLGVDQGGR